MSKKALPILILSLLALLFSGFAVKRLAAVAPHPVSVKAEVVEDVIPKSVVESVPRGAAGDLGCSSCEGVGGLYESQVKEAEFPFNALGFRWEDGSSTSPLNLQVRFRGEGGNWSEWVEVLGDDEDAKDGTGEKGVHFGKLVWVGEASEFQYRVFYEDSLPEVNVGVTYINSTDEGPQSRTPSQILSDAFLGFKELWSRLGRGDAFAQSPSKAPTVTNRSGWGADEGLRYCLEWEDPGTKTDCKTHGSGGEEIWVPAYADIEKVIIHHTVTKAEDPTPEAVIRAIYRFHAVDRGWGDIGYNFLVDRHGQIYEGRHGGDGVVAGHALGYNTGSVGVGVLGNFECTGTHSCDSVNNQIKNALQKVAVWKLAKYGVDPTVSSFFVDQSLPAIVSHNQVGNTQCPGTNLKHDMDALRSRAKFMPQEVLVKFGGGVSDSQISSFASRHSLSQLSTHEGRIRRFRFPNTTLSKYVISNTEKESIVKYTSVNKIYLSSLTPDDPKYPDQWNLSNIKAGQAWDVTPGGASSVTLAVLDTGLAYEAFSDSSGTYAKATDFTATNFVAGHDFVNSDSHPNDDHGHGTAVASVAASTTNNTTGIAGIAYQTSIMPVKVLDENGGGTDATVADGIRWAVDNGADVINMSFGSNDGSVIIEDAVKYAIRSGISLVASAGNQGREGLVYPARYRDVVAVGASDLNDDRTGYSNYGTRLDILAPGGDLNADLDGDSTADGVLFETLDLASTPDDDYTAFKFDMSQGTSYSAPHVSATIAMMLSQTGNVGAVDLRDALVDADSAKGVVDALASVNSPPSVTTPLGVVKNDNGDPNFYLYNAPSKVERRGLTAVDFWAVPDNNVVAVSGFKDGSNKRVGVIRYTDKPDRRDYNFYLYALNESGIAKSTLVGANYWSIPDGGIPLDVAGVDIDGDGTDEVAVLKKKKKSWGWDTNLYIYNLPNGVENTAEVGADYWAIPDGGSYLLTGVGDVNGDGKGDIGVMKKTRKSWGWDHNFYVFKAPVGVQKAELIGANYWDLPDRGENVDMSGVGDIDGNGKKDIAVMKRVRKSWGWDYNLYVYPVPNSVATNDPYFAADYWRIPLGNNALFTAGNPGF